MRTLTHPLFGEATEVLEVTEHPTPQGPLSPPRPPPLSGDAPEVLGVPDPPPPGPGPGEVRVPPLLSPIHNHALWTIRGTYGFKPELPAASGTEAVGVVDALGEG